MIRSKSSLDQRRQILPINGLLGISESGDPRLKRDRQTQLRLQRRMEPFWDTVQKFDLPQQT